MKLVLDETKEALRVQQDQLKAINTRASFLIGLIGITIGALGKPVEPAFLNLLWGVPAAAAIVFALMAFRPHGLAVNVKIAKLRELIADEEQDTQRFLIDNRMAMAAQNEQMLTRRASFVNKGLFFYAIAVGLLIAINVILAFHVT